MPPETPDSDSPEKRELERLRESVAGQHARLAEQQDNFRRLELRVAVFERQRQPQLFIISVAVLAIIIGAAFALYLFFLSSIGENPVRAAKQLAYFRTSDARAVELLFATNRTAGPTKNQRITFSAERSPHLIFGAALVHIPTDHKIGRLELPKERGWIFKYTDKPNPKEHFVISEVSVFNEAKVFEIVGGADPAGTALIFVHGFNTTFDQSLLRMAQIVWDLQFRGLPIAFSWPSYGDEHGEISAITHYPYDLTSALDSRDAFLHLLELLHLNQKIHTIHLIAHSMGNFLAIETLNRAVHHLPGLRISEIVMAAPDIDRDGFPGLVSPIAPIAAGMTLYASSKDYALVAARKFWKRPRAGDIPPDGSPIVLPKVDTIDVTAFGEELFGLNLNHDTFATNRSLIDDIGRIFAASNRAPGRPPNLRSPQIRGAPERQEPPQYWKYPD
jgi:esterase/lipase superfamily enzyme